MKILFAGCSVTAGAGLANEINDVNNYPNMFTDAIYPTAKLTNIAVVGSSNFGMLSGICRAIKQETYDLVFVGVTSYPRFEFFFDFGLYPNQGKYTITPNNALNEYRRDPSVFVSKSNINAFKNELLKTHDHYHIVDLLTLTSTLTQVHPNIYFINVLAPWSTDFFTVKDYNFPSDLDEYTQKLLDVDHRIDSDISILYQKMHRDYLLAVGNKHWDSYWARWINLYDSIRNYNIDLGNDNAHPGPKTHQQFANVLATNYKRLITL